MSFDRLSHCFCANVPYFKFFIIANRCKFILVVMIPTDVLDDLIVSLECYKRVHCVCKLILLVNIPETNAVVITA